jgi:hypothetical protein
MASALKEVGLQLFHAGHHLLRAQRGHLQHSTCSSCQVGRVAARRRRQQLACAAIDCRDAARMRATPGGGAAA